MPSLVRASGEIKATDVSGRNVYAIVLNSISQVWTGSTFAATTSGNFVSSPVVLSEITGTGFYSGNFPSTTLAGRYTVLIYERAGASPVVGDVLVQQGVIDWTGFNLVGSANSLLSGTQTYTHVGNITGNLSGTIGSAQAFSNSVLTAGLTTLLTGSATAGSNVNPYTITLAGNTNGTNTYGAVNQVKGNYVLITSGTGAGQSRTITGWDGTSLLTVGRAWDVTPTSGSGYAIIGNPHPVLDSNLAVISASVTAPVTLAAGQNVGTITGIVGTTFPASVPSLSAITAVIPTDYQQRAVPVTLPTTAPTGYGGGAGSTFDAFLQVKGAYSAGTWGAYLASLPDPSGVSTLLTRLGVPLGASISADIQTRLAGSAYVLSPTISQISSTVASALPTDYQQRAVAVTLPTTPPTGYGGGTGSTFDPFTLTPPTGSYAAGSYGALLFNTGKTAINSTVMGYGTGQDPATFIFSNDRWQAVEAGVTGTYSNNPVSRVITFTMRNGKTFTGTVSVDSQGRITGRVATQPQ